MNSIARGACFLEYFDNHVDFAASDTRKLHLNNVIIFEWEHFWWSGRFCLKYMLPAPVEINWQIKILYTLWRKAVHEERSIFISGYFAIILQAD
jgi:hypothetical protein